MPLAVVPHLGERSWLPFAMNAGVGLVLHPLRAAATDREGKIEQLALRTAETDALDARRVEDTGARHGFARPFR